MRIFVESVTDNWLGAVAALDRPVFLNFWRPHRCRKRQRSEPGDILLFTRRGSPQQVLGFAMVHRHMWDLVTKAWSRLGENNGASSLADMQQQAGIDQTAKTSFDAVIQSTILINPLFLPPDNAANLSRRFLRQAEHVGLSGPAANRLIISLRLQAAGGEGLFAYKAVQDHFLPAIGQDQTSIQHPLTPVVEASTWSAYHHRCAVTSWKTDLTLRVVYIRPPNRGGSLEVSNTMLLRSELADLYNALLIAFTEEGKLVMHVELGRTDPRAYEQLAKYRLRTLSNVCDQPRLDDVVWRLNGPFVTRSF